LGTILFEHLKSLAVAISTIVEARRFASTPYQISDYLPVQFFFANYKIAQS
jgi:hypothetical protein